MNPNLLGAVPLFASLSSDELAALSGWLRPSSFPAGTVLCREGEIGRCFYVVLSGQIEIIKALGTEDERLVAVRGGGEFVGEMSLINPEGVRTASVRTVSPVQALEFSRAEFHQLLERHPTLSYEMLRVMSRRLTESHDQALRDLHEKNRELTLAYEELKAAQQQLVEKERLERELELARQMQASLLPREAPQVPGWEFAAWWQPARVVGGDFYDYFSIPPGPHHAPQVGFLIADVSDKGIAAALFMALSRSILRASMRSAQNPVEGIAQANQLVCAEAADGTFVTLFYAQLDGESGDLVYVNAGHNPPLLYRMETGEVQELGRTGLPLGILPACEYAQQKVRLHPGDLLLLYTDGATEALNEPRQEFGVERLEELLREHPGGSAGESMTALQAALRQHIGTVPLFDDITAVALKREIQPA